MADMLDLFADVRIDGIDIEEDRELDYDEEEDYRFDDVFRPVAGRGPAPGSGIRRGFWRLTLNGPCGSGSFCGARGR